MFSLGWLSVATRTYLAVMRFGQSRIGKRRIALRTCDELQGLPLAIACVVFHTAGYFVRLTASARVAKNDKEETFRGYFIEESMRLTILFLALITISPLGAQGSKLEWGFVPVWSSAALPRLVIMALAFTAISVFSALMLLDPSENTFCVPFERVAGTIAAYLLAFSYGQAPPTGIEIVGTLLPIAAIALLFVAPRWRVREAVPQASRVA